MFFCSRTKGGGIKIDTKFHSKINYIIERRVDYIMKLECRICLSEKERNLLNDLLIKVSNLNSSSEIIRKIIKDTIENEQGKTTSTEKFQSIESYSNYLLAMFNLQKEEISKLRELSNELVHTISTLKIKSFSRKETTSQDDDNDFAE